MNKGASGSWLLTAGSLVHLSVFVLCVAMGGVTILINPGPNYRGPLDFTLFKVSPALMVLNFVGAVLMLMDAFASRRRLSVRIFVAASSAIVLSYTVLWTMVYGGIIDDSPFGWSIFERNLTDEGVTMYVWDRFFGVTVPLCILDLFIGLRSVAPPFRRLSDRAYDALIMQD